METNNPQNPDNGKLFPANEPPMIIEPLKVKRPSRTVREIEALVVGLQVSLVTELNAAKEEILQALHEGQVAVEAMAREMERKSGEPAAPQDGGSL
jgi:hypothetical protein